MFTKSKQLLAASTVVIAAAAPSAASAKFELNPEPSVAPQSSPVIPSPAQPSATSDFQWGDAAIGAAGAFTLVAAAGGTSVLARRRRQQGDVRRNAVA
jgi:hypothetical protein